MTITLEINKQCVVCGSQSTYIDKNGRPNWILKDIGLICKRCYLRLYTHPQHNPNRIRFKPSGKQLHIQQKVTRLGICQNCGKTIASGEIKRTNLHHTSYDPLNPLANTSELCVPCHRKIHPGIRKQRIEEKFKQARKPDAKEAATA